MSDNGASKKAKRAEVLAQMDEAGAVAQRELDAMLTDMSKEERDGAYAVAQWLEDHFMAAGYKRLSKVLIGVLEAISG